MTTRLKVFNLKEANALLPELESRLSQLEARHEAFKQLEDKLFFEEILEQASLPEVRLQELEETLLRLEEEIQRIRELGCRLRHPERGLVDFLARKDQEWIYFCWRRGEKEIRFYHNLREGFFERRPLGGERG